MRHSGAMRQHRTRNLEVPGSRFASPGTTEANNSQRYVGSHLARSSIGQASPMEHAMPTRTQTEPVSKPALWSGRLLSGLVILFLLFDGAIKLVPWPVVTETMDRIGYGSSETLARTLGVITIACTVLYAIPPTS